MRKMERFRSRENAGKRRREKRGEGERTRKGRPRGEKDAEKLRWTDSIYTHT